MLVLIEAHPNNNIVSLFFDKSITVGRESWSGPFTSPEVHNVLYDIGVTPERYIIEDAFSGWAESIHSFAWAVLTFKHDEDLVMAKLAFDQVGPTQNDVREKMNIKRKGIKT